MFLHTTDRHAANVRTDRATPGPTEAESGHAWLVKRMARRPYISIR